MEHSLTVDYRLAFVRGYFMLKWLLFPFLRYLSTFEWLVCNYREKYLSPMLLAWASRLQFSRGHVQGTNIVTMQVVVLLSLVGTCSLISFFFLPQTRNKNVSNASAMYVCLFVYFFVVVVFNARSIHIESVNKRNSPLRSVKTVSRRPAQKTTTY